jgi:hypothetical protein
MLTKFSFFILLITIAIACRKTENIVNENAINPPAGVVPHLEFVSVNKLLVREYLDTLVFTIRYLDGDGDLGFADADSMSIVLKDSRDTNNLIFEYPLAPLAPAGTNLTIQGELTVYLQNPIRLNNQSVSETARFYLQIRDRANNRSNIVQSPDITILP